MDNRENWDTYFMGIAERVSTRSTCTRKHVGAVIVRDVNILSTGYNGSVPGGVHCNSVGCDMEGGHCVATIHAEANAIVQAAKHGTMIQGATMYTTLSPCWSCFKLIITAGIVRVCYGEKYSLTDKVLFAAKSLNINLEHIGGVCTLLGKKET